MTADQAVRDFLPEKPDEEDEAVSRRQFLTGAVVGGAAGLAVAAGTSVSVWKVADASAQGAMDASAAEIERLQGLVDLYQDLEKIGLDSILQAGMLAVTLPIEGVELGARALKGGLDAVEAALISLEEALPTARESMLWLETRVSAIADGIEKLEIALYQALDKATGNPIGEALKDLTGMVLDNLPFGLGDRIRDVLDGLVRLVTGVDELVEGINTRLLEPLHEQWFSAEEGQGLGAALVNPLIEHILDPLQAHLEDLAILADTWQRKLVEPTQEALEERAQVREEIVRYKGKHGLG